MSLRSLESAITSEARRHFNNSKLRVKDIQEWSGAPIIGREDESADFLPLNRVYVAIKAEHDKRASTAKEQK